RVMESAFMTRTRRSSNSQSMLRTAPWPSSRPTPSADAHSDDVRAATSSPSDPVSPAQSITKPSRSMATAPETPGTDVIAASKSRASSKGGSAVVARVALVDSDRDAQEQLLHAVRDGSRPANHLGPIHPAEPESRVRFPLRCRDDSGERSFAGIAPE